MLNQSVDPWTNRCGSRWNESCDRRLVSGALFEMTNLAASVMNRKTRHWTAAWRIALLAFAAFGTAAPAAEPEQKSVAVRHPNLLLNPTEIDQIKLKVRDHPWAARLLDRVKAKAEKDGAVTESAVAYALTGESRYARSVRDRLLGETREQMPHYEKIDITVEPEWGRWSWWGATA